MINLLEYDPVVSAYRAFFALFDWSLVEHWQEQRPTRGRPAHPESAYLKAFLVRINEGFIYSTQLRDFLVTHPFLVIELGSIWNWTQAPPMALMSNARFPVAIGSARNCAGWTEPSCKTCLPRR